MRRQAKHSLAHLTSKPARYQKPVLLAVLLGLLSACATTTITPPVGVLSPYFAETLGPEESFQNPILPIGADPWVVLHNDTYYYLTSDGQSTLFLAETPDFTQLSSVPLLPIWTAPEGTTYSHHIWAPEIHFIEGAWYIYFSADDGEIFNHRVFALRSLTDDPFGEYEYAGQLAPAVDTYAIDGTVWQHADGSYYYLWSGWESQTRGAQHVFIAPMSDPLTVSGDAVQIASPEHAWERPWMHPPVNEGPQVIEHGGRTHIVYSANVFWSDDYSLGLLSLEPGADPLDPESWTKHPEPVFRKANGIRGPGHASFTRSPDLRQWWIVYHSLIDDRDDNARMIRTQQFAWTEDGYPEFFQPVPPDAILLRPSGVQ